MIDQIRQMAINETDRIIPGKFRPGCQTLDCSAWIGGVTHVDFEQSPPAVLTFTGTSWDRRSASNGDLSAILSGLQQLASPVDLTTRLGVYTALTTAERDSIRAAFPDFGERLALVAEPISITTILPYFRQLVAADLLTAERFTEITGESP